MNFRRSGFITMNAFKYFHTAFFSMIFNLFWKFMIILFHKFFTIRAFLFEVTQRLAFYIFIFSRMKTNGTFSLLCIADYRIKKTHFNHLFEI
ncbi:MAG: hypothetical protein CFE38_06140 [Comamonadaceae bacterium PBBC1]|nr:MAG: hypothetical protein CFE38_06140 [Comamonadaceae bacterium PBBC1]